MRKCITAAACCMLALLALAAHHVAWTQGDRLSVFRDQERRALSEPFKGVTTRGEIVPGLFRIQSTGVSTHPVRAAAEAFLASLTEEQRKRTLFPVDDDEWRKWDNRHFPPRQGVSFKELNAGSEPVRAESGKFKGTVVLQDEQDKGLRLYNALDRQQQAKALIRGNKGPMENIAQAYSDNMVLDYAGIPASQLTAAQKNLLLEVIAEYNGNLKEGHARVRMDEVRRHLEGTYFGWIGGAGPGSVFYYRIQSPVILIEFDHQSRVAPTRTNTATRDHIHTVVRTPNGNDYGKDLLRQHHERQHGTRK